jgi:hypothetical protein
MAAAAPTLPKAAVFSCSRFLSSSASMEAKCSSFAKRALGCVRKIASQRACYRIIQTNKYTREEYCEQPATFNAYACLALIPNWSRLIGWHSTYPGFFVIAQQIQRSGGSIHAIYLVFVSVLNQSIEYRNGVAQFGSLR